MAWEIRIRFLPSTRSCVPGSLAVFVPSQNNMFYCLVVVLVHVFSGRPVLKRPGQSKAFNLL
eukprot:1835929-Rhodomonas_salina.1